MKLQFNRTDKKISWLDIIMAVVLIPLISFMTTAFNSNDINHDPKTDLYWLVGTWENADKAGFFEKWDYGVNALTGKGYSIKKDKEKLVETLSITSQGHSLFYHATVEGQNDGKTITFKLTKAENNSFTFSNPEHDFPQDITYTKVSNEAFKAVLTAKGPKGDAVSVTLNMKKVK